MEKTERRKEQERTERTDNNRFWNSRLNKHRKRGEIKTTVTYSSCLHDQQDLCWGNTSRDTHEEPQEPHPLKLDAKLSLRNSPQHSAITKVFAEENLHFL